jgi:uncharacterized spore protein YtfJ
MKAEEVFESLLEKIQKQSGAKLVFGDPVEKADKIVIPVAKAMYGFGGGAGKFHTEGEGSEEGQNEKGAGMGGGLSARPVGVIEITEERTTFIPINDTSRLIGIFLLGAILGRLLIRRSRKK